MRSWLPLANKIKSVQSIAVTQTCCPGSSNNTPGQLRRERENVRLELPALESFKSGVHTNSYEMLCTWSRGEGAGVAGWGIPFGRC